MTNKRKVQRFRRMRTKERRKAEKERIVRYKNNLCYDPLTCLYFLSNDALRSVSLLNSVTVLHNAMDKYGDRVLKMLGGS